MKPDSRNPTWRARCEDPDTGRRVKVRLDPMGAGRNAQTRRQWAIQKAQSIARRRDALASGAPRATGTALESAIERYFEDHPQLREQTTKSYRRATGKLTTWCSKNGVSSADRLVLAHLVAFCSALAGEPRQRHAEGKRGARAPTNTKRSPTAVNVEIRSTKVVLNYLRRLGLLPNLSRDDITDGLRTLKTPRPAPAILRSADLRALLEAAQAHDAQTFKATRGEHAGESQPGATRRYPALTPFVTVVMLTGMRFGELFGLDWSEVDLEEQRIHLGTRTKTKHARDIDLELSPALLALFTSMAKGAPKRGPVWKLTAEQVRAAARRLARYGAPEGWNWQKLRRTCGTFLTNAPGIFGAASAYRSAKQLGHSVQVAEKYYLGVVKVPKEATTLEAAMGVGESLAS